MRQRFTLPTSRCIGIEMNKRFSLLGIALCMTLVAGCELFGPSDRSRGRVDYSKITTISYSQHVEPLLQAKFAPLLENETGLSLESWGALMAGSQFGEVVIPFDAENSLLLELATKLEPPHPSQLTSDSLRRDELDFMTRWINEGARNDAGNVPYEGADSLLYVCNQDAGIISVIDSKANVVIRNVKLADYGITGSPKPHHVVVEPDGSFWYVSLISANTILKFDRNNELVGQVNFFETPGMLALNPNSGFLYAGRSLTAVDPPRSIGRIRTADMAVDQQIGVLFQRPHALRVSPDGRYVYTASLVSNQIASIDAITNDVSISSFDGDPQAYLQMAISPDARTMYITGQVASQLQVIDITDPDSLTLRKTFDVNPSPWHPVLTQDGSTLYFGNKGSNTVTGFNTNTETFSALINAVGLAQPHGSALSPDGRYLYISNNNSKQDYTPRYNFGDNTNIGTIAVINTATNTVEKVLEVEEFPAGVGVR